MQWDNKVKWTEINAPILSVSDGVDPAAEWFTESLQMCLLGGDME